MQTCLWIAKLDALKSAHDLKVRALMKSITQLQDQVQNLRSQDKEHRRSALIQNLRKQQREQDLLIDVLKQTLLEKVPEFQDSKAIVNDFVLKKSAGAPLRFRPKTREELENELSDLDQKYKRALANLRTAQVKPARSISSEKEEPPNIRSRPVESEESEEEPISVKDASVDEGALSIGLLVAYYRAH